MSNSCLVEKIGYHLRLSEPDKALLARLEEAEEAVSAGAQVREAGSTVEHMYVVRAGWFYDHVLLPDGRRQVLHLHYPGDIVGLPEIPFARTGATLTSATGGVLCPFPKQALDQVFERAPRLAALLFSIGMVEHAVLADRIRVIGRMGAKERVAHFLLEVVSRLRVTRRDLGARFELPLTQSVIGDAVGLSNVYVSRALSQLEASGAIRRRGRNIELLDEAGMKREVDFEDRHFRIDTSWFPGS